jgi:D-alanyl-D-alanine-carboxypeptidase/D-alanyl-D-alanine-endopeptidase
MQHSLRIVPLVVVSLLPCAFGGLVACSDASPVAPIATAEPAGPASDGGAAAPSPEVSTPTPGADAGKPAFAALDAAIVAARAKVVASDAGAAPAMALSLYDAQDRVVFQKSYGDFSPGKRVAVASASKMVSGLVLFAVIGKGKLSLDSTTGDVLGWAAPKDKITLRHLLSFTSGLRPEAACTGNPLVTLAACVDDIAQSAPLASPGTRFDYGSVHLHVAARMAEVATGKTWEALFDENVRAPLNLPQDVAYFTGPRQAVGKQNPLVAGGMRASMDEYAKILAQVYKRGAGAVVAPAALFDAQAIEPYRVTVGGSPVAKFGYGWRYGLTAWLQCSTPEAGCASISSPGAFGFTPWLDRTKGYYAILGMELDRSSDDVVEFSVRLEQDLEPLIPAALAP